MMGRVAAWGVLAGVVWLGATYGPGIVRPWSSVVAPHNAVLDQTPALPPGCKAKGCGK